MLKDILKKIPGFRTGHKWKMVLAVIIYLVIILVLTNPSGVTSRDKLVSIMEFLIMIGIPFVLITNLGNIRSKLPIFNKKTIKFTILGVFITLVIMGIGFSMVDTLKSPEQKQLDLITAQQAEVKAEAKKVASALNDKISALGDVNTLTYDKADAVMSIRKEYAALTTEEKGLVTKLALLESAEKKIKDLQAIADKAAAEKAAEEKAAEEKAVAYDKAKKIEDKKKAEAEKALEDSSISIAEGVELQSAAKRWVEQVIKAPSTAEYPGSWLDPYDGWSIAQNKSIYEISSYVDSQNSFGAMIRSKYYMKINDTGGSYKMLKFVFDGRRIR